MKYRMSVGSVGCRRKGEGYEVTMRYVEGKERLPEGLRVKGMVIKAEGLTAMKVMVSFLNMPVYIGDSQISFCTSLLDEHGSN